jgi:hypothetical protein
MGRASRRKIAHIVSRRLEASPCPNCGKILSGVTGASIGAFFEPGPIRYKGHATLCCYCGALLIFADDAGRVRAMSERERNSLHLAPIVEQLYALWRADHPAGDFTKKRFN